MPTEIVICKNLQDKCQENLWIYVDQPHSYSVKTLENLTPIGSDPLTNVYLMRHTLTPISKMARIVSLPVSTSACNDDSSILFAL